MKLPGMNPPALCAAIALTVAASGGFAAEWKPEKNVEVISASAAGGAADGTARLVQRLLQEKKLIPVSSVVINKPGGQQTVAMSYLAQNAGDAHYIAVASTPLLSNHITGASKQHYADFTPLALLFTEYVALSVRTESPIRDAKDLIERMRKDPASLSYGVGTSIGGINHIGAALGLKAAGVDIRKMKAVVFNSSGQAATAVLGGHLDVGVSLVNVAVPQVQGGKMRVLAVTAPQRLAALPGVPTWKELVLDAVTMNWRMIIGPRGMTPEQIAYWDGVMKRLTESAEWNNDLRANVQEAVYVPSGGMRKFLDGQYEQFKVVLTELGLVKP
jgi:putative tricarboxylic transport membrane protein